MLWAKKPSLRQVIESALKNNELMDLKYKSAKKEETERAVLPESIWVEDGHEYFLGYCTLRQAERTFRLDRIKEIKII